MSYKLYKGDCLEVMNKLIKEGIKVDMILMTICYITVTNTFSLIGS